MIRWCTFCAVSLLCFFLIPTPCSGCMCAMRPYGTLPVSDDAFSWVFIISLRSLDFEELYPFVRGELSSVAVCMPLRDKLKQWARLPAWSPLSSLHHGTTSVQKGRKKQNANKTTNDIFKFMLTHLHNFLLRCVARSDVLAGRWKRGTRKGRRTGPTAVVIGFIYWHDKCNWANVWHWKYEGTQNTSTQMRHRRHPSRESTGSMCLQNALRLVFFCFSRGETDAWGGRPINEVNKNAKICSLAQRYSFACACAFFVPSHSFTLSVCCGRIPLLVKWYLRLVCERAHAFHFLFAAASI